MTQQLTGIRFMLYDPDRHEALSQLAWNESSAIAAIERIVHDTEARYSEENYWPLHPADRQGANDSRTYETALHEGR